MVSFHPYRTWPLHIKLFTEDAVKKWDNAVNKTGVLPAGLTIIIELEGVDGKSGITGSGRQVPIDVSDGALGYLAPFCVLADMPMAVVFSRACLEKHRCILASHHQPSCAICGTAVENYSTVCAHMDDD